MEERGRVTGGGWAGCGLGGWGGVRAAAGPAGGRATVLGDWRRAAGGVIWCECSMFGGWRRLILGRLRFWPNKAKREGGAKAGEWCRESECVSWGHFGRGERLWNKNGAYETNFA